MAHDDIDDIDDEGQTPGPWTYIRVGDYWRITPTCIEGKDNGEGNEADYRLAAAAPDLLAALETMLREMEAEIGKESLEYGDTYQRALAAIRKARGQ
jgi:hypothetical protein